MKSKVNISKVFVGFIIASFLIWVLINLSKEYTSKVFYTVKYQTLPQNKLLQEKPQEALPVLVKGTGFKLLSSKIANKIIFLKTDKLLHKKNNQFYFLPNFQKNAIQEQLQKGLQIESILQDTIFLKIGKLASKKVPVIADAKLQFHAGYALSKDLEFTPKNVTISGVFQEIDKIKNVSTVQFELEDITENFSKKLALEVSDKPKNIRFSHQEVTVNGFVDKFTEGEFEIPVNIENVPFGTRLNIFPKKVKVTYKVGLKDFGKVTKDLFLVVCDFEEVQKKDLKYLLPKIKRTPAIVSSLKITPNKIEYLIHK